MHAELARVTQASSELKAQMEEMRESNSSALREGERVARDQTAEAEQAACTAREATSAMQAELARATEASSDLQAQVEAIRVSSDAAVQAGVQEAKDQVAEAQVQIASMQSELERLTEALRLAGGGQTHTTLPSCPSTSSTAEEPWCDRVTVSIPTTTTTLAQLLAIVNSTIVPTVFDLGGQQIQGEGSEGLSLNASYVTLRNGTILLGASNAAGGTSLCVKGRNVEFDDIMIIGGHVGLSVRPGSELTLRDCVIFDAHMGVQVGGGEGDTPTIEGQTPAQRCNLLALNLTISDCGQGGSFTVGSGGAAVLSDCNFSGGGGHGILVWGDVPTKLTANRCVCSGNEGTGVIVHSGAVAELVGCSLMDNSEGSVMVWGSGSRALVQGCTFSTEPVLCEGGVLTQL